MEEIKMWRSCDGQIFETANQCRAHEQTLAASVLNQYVLAYDAEGKSISWADNDSFAMFALVRKIPTDEELENKELDIAWADYLDADLECELTRGRKKTGWWIRDPYQEYWHPYQEWIAEVEKLKNVMCQLKELPWG